MEQHDVWDALSLVGGAQELMKEVAFGHEEGCSRKFPGDGGYTSGAASSAPYDQAKGSFVGTHL